MKYSLEESVEKAAEAGYDAIDLIACAPHAEPREINRKNRAKLRKLVDSYGLSINQIASFGHPTTGIFAEMEGYVKAQLERLDFAKDVGADHLEIVPGFKRPDLPVELTWKWAVENHSKIVEYAEKIGVPIAVEFEPIQPSQEMWGKPMPPNVHDLKTLKKFIDEIGSGFCRANLDIGHCNIVAKGNPENIRHELLALKDYIIGVHCNDNDGITDLNLIPGKGTCNFEYYLKVLDQMGYKKFVGIELEGEDDPEPAAKESLNYIKNVLLRINAYG